MWQPNSTHDVCHTCRYEVDIYEGRKWIGGKVASYIDKDGNHIEVCGGEEKEGRKGRQEDCTLL